MKIKLLIVYLVCLFNFGSLALAMDDSFTVELEITGDTSPPSVPANVTAVPVTSAQINLSWDASTDNNTIGGYQVFRDLSQIATTTLLNYSDTGLAPSTTYSYFIRAFDNAGNISSSSVTVSTTTLATVAPSTPTATSYGGSQGFRTALSSMDVFVSNSDAEFSFSGNTYITYTLRWGLTLSYELGFIESSLYSKDHTTQIPDLEPGENYYYQLEIIDRSGRLVETINDSITTIPLETDPFVSNVSNFTATVDGSTALLTWDSPILNDATVRVVRNPWFYPLHDADGYVVYEGKKNSVIDDNFVYTEGVAYYAVFVIDQYGNKSSGTVLRVALTDDTTEITSEEDIVESPFSELSFKQSDITQLYQGNIIELLSRYPFEVTLPVSDTKIESVVFVLESDAYKTSYLMRRDYEKDIYSSIIPPLVAATYNVHVYLYDAQGVQRKMIEGTIRTITPDGAASMVSGRVFTAGLFITSLALFIFILLAIRMLWSGLRITK